MDAKVQTVILNQQNNSSPPSSTNGYANRLKISFGLPMTLVGKEIALYQLFLYYSWFNISKENNNNTFGILQTKYAGLTVDSTQLYNVELKDGSYGISDINACLYDFMFAKGLGRLDDEDFTPGLTLVVDPVRYCCRLLTLYTKPTVGTVTYNYQLVIPPTEKQPGREDTQSANSISQILGFPSGLWPANISDRGDILGSVADGDPNEIVYGHAAPYPPDLTRTNQINVSCNMVNNSLVSANQSSTIYSFSPNVPFGSQITVTPSQLVWYPIIDGQYSYLEVNLMDDDFRPLQIRDPIVSCTILIRSKGDST
jgi:hypothetical protein